MSTEEQRAWYRARNAKSKEYMREYRAANKERLRASNKEWMRAKRASDPSYRAAESNQHADYRRRKKLERAINESGRGGPDDYAAS